MIAGTSAQLSLFRPAHTACTHCAMAATRGNHMLMHQATAAPVAPTCGIARVGCDLAEELEVGSHALELQAVSRNASELTDWSLQSIKLSVEGNEEVCALLARFHNGPSLTCVSSSAACSLAMAAGRPSGECTISLASRES